MNWIALTPTKAAPSFVFEQHWGSLIGKKSFKSTLKEQLMQFQDAQLYTVYSDQVQKLKSSEAIL